MKHLRKETDNAPQTSTRRKSRCHPRARSEDRSRSQSRHPRPGAHSEDRGRGRGRHTWAPSADLASIRRSGSASLHLLPDVVEQLDPHPSGEPGFVAELRHVSYAPARADRLPLGIQRSSSTSQRPRAANLARLKLGTAIHHGELSQKAHVLTAPDHYAATAAQTKVGDPQGSLLANSPDQADGGSCPEAPGSGAARQAVWVGVPPPWAYWFRGVRRG
jgi:hypothetical protein